VSYLEGARPDRDENQLHAAVVELVALDNAQIKYSTVQNCIRATKKGAADLQFRHETGEGPGVMTRRSRGPSGDRVGHHVEIPSVLLIATIRGDLFRRRDEQPPAGRHGNEMIHIGRTRKARSCRRESAGHGQNSYAGSWR